MHGWRASTISSRCDRNRSSPVIPSLVFPRRQGDRLDTRVHPRPDEVREVDWVGGITARMIITIDKIWPTLSRAARALVVCFAFVGSQLGAESPAFAGSRFDGQWNLVFGDTARRLRSQLQFHGRRREWEHHSSQHPHVQGPRGVVGRRSRISQGWTEVRVRIGQDLRRGWPRRLERPLGPIAMCGDVDGAEELKLPRTASTDDVTHYALASAMQTAATEAWAAAGRTASRSNGAAGVVPAWASGSASSNGSRHLERAGLSAAEPSAR